MLGFGALGETALAEIPSYGGAFAPPNKIDFRFISEPNRRRQSTLFQRIVIDSPKQRRCTSTRLARLAVSTPEKLKRQFITVVQGPNFMPKGNDFSPIDTNETVTLTFDFGPWLDKNVTISSVTSVTAAAFNGTDGSANSRMVSTPTIVASPYTGAANAAVLQKMGNNPINGVTYRVDAVVATSDGQTLNLWAHIKAQTPN